MQTALVTGINGFTGLHLVPELQRTGFSVTGIGQESSKLVGASYINCDLTDRDSTIEAITPLCPDVVIHLAGVAFAVQDDAEPLYRTHIVGTRNLLEALALCSRTPRAVLLASSAQVYGNALDAPIVESTMAAPANDYAVSKLAMEYMSRLWLDKLPIIIARPFNYTGHGQSLQFLLPKIVDHFRRRAVAIELGNLEVVRDFTDVRSLVRIYGRIIASASGGDVYNVCSGIGHSLQDVIAIMHDLSGHNLEVVVNPKFVRKNEVRKLIGSHAKLEAAIGPLDLIPLQETLRWMLETN